MHTVGEVQLRPPVRRGSIDALLDEVSIPGVLIVADGTFHQYPSVGHAEIRRALNSRWSVWGVSSMGAIRAAEMRHMGMRGFGTVYQRYAEDPDFKDDEVALLHGAERPFTPVTEPLIHIRYLLSDLARREVISQHQVSAICRYLEGIWYGYRTLELVRDLLCEKAGLDKDCATSHLKEIERFRIKTQDLTALLSSRPWLA